MVMEIIDPVHWTVRAFIEPKDLRQMVWMVLKNPILIVRCIKFLFSKGPVSDASETINEQLKEVVAPIKVEMETSKIHTQKTGPGPIPSIDVLERFHSSNNV